MQNGQKCCRWPTLLCFTQNYRASFNWSQKEEKGKKHEQGTQKITVAVQLKPSKPMFRKGGEERKVLKRDVCSNATNNWQLPGLTCSVLPTKWQLGPPVTSRPLMVNAAVTHTLNTTKVIGLRIGVHHCSGCCIKRSGPRAVPAYRRVPGKPCLLQHGSLLQ